MTENTEYRNALPLQSMLLEYRLESILGAGTFGITYLAWDTHLEKHVAIKEYLPGELAVRALDGSVVPVTSGHEHDYKWGLERFIMEARTLAKFGHPHIVRVNRYFESNGTGYMVMDYERGKPLNEQLRHQPHPDEASLKTLLFPLLDGLRAVHETGFLHRDIKPGNIFIRENSSPVLIDFGAARQAIRGATRSLTAVLTPGYAPLEQYSSEARQGPWTDIYAMGGVLYRAMTNANPPDAVSRMRDDSVPLMLATVRGRYTEPFLRAVEWALAIDEKARPQDVDAWRNALLGGQPAPQADATTIRPVAAATINPETAAGMDAPTLRLAPRPASDAPTLPPSRRAPPPQSRRRWTGIIIAAIAVIAVAIVWNKQRQARQSDPPPQIATPAVTKSPEPAPKRPEPSAERPPIAKPQPRERVQAAPPAAVPRDNRAPVRDAVALPPITADERVRPSRDRDPRPGDAEQVRNAAAAEFRAVDRDGNGYLSRDDVRGRFPALERQFERVDTDGDGRISAQEFQRLRIRQAEVLRKKAQQ